MGWGGLGVPHTENWAHLQHQATREIFLDNSKLSMPDIIWKERSLVSCGGYGSAILVQEMPCLERPLSTMWGFLDALQTPCRPWQRREAASTQLKFQTLTRVRFRHGCENWQKSKITSVQLFWAARTNRGACQMKDVKGFSRAQGTSRVWQSSMTRHEKFIVLLPILTR